MQYFLRTTILGNQMASYDLHPETTPIYHCQYKSKFLVGYDQVYASVGIKVTFQNPIS